MTIENSRDIIKIEIGDVIFSKKFFVLPLKFFGNAPI